MPACPGRFLTNRVVAARVEWMAFKQAAQRKPGTFQGTMYPKRENRIFGTGWIKTATGGKQGGYQYLIHADQENKDLCEKFPGHS